MPLLRKKQTYEKGDIIVALYCYYTFSSEIETYDFGEQYPVCMLSLNRCEGYIRPENKAYYRTMELSRIDISPKSFGHCTGTGESTICGNNILGYVSGKINTEDKRAIKFFLRKVAMKHWDIIERNFDELLDKRRRFSGYIED